MGQAFHLALPVKDLQEARQFYSKILGCAEKRSSFNWVDYDFFGNQLSLHLVGHQPPRQESTSIDGDQVPALHYGMILTKKIWEELRDSLVSKDIKFIIGPRIRFLGADGEQGTFFISDPSGNYLEFKYFTDTSKGLWY